MNDRKTINRILAVIFAILIWQIAAMIVGYEFILASPINTVKALFSIISEKSFWLVVSTSVFRIISGYLIAFASGFVMALLAGRFEVIETLLWPFMIMIKSVPVSSFIILSLFWFSSKGLAVFVPFLTVLPVVYNNILSGYKKTDTELLNAASVFGANWINKVRVVFLPQLEPFICAAASTGCGMAFKSGIAAEVIAVLSDSIGEAIYMSKVYFAMDELFAWTLVIILCTAIFEKIFSLLCHLLIHRLGHL